MALHKQQGCLPSNVWVKASVSDPVRRLAANIAVQATDCSTAQCAPVEMTSATTTQNLPNRADTTASYTSFIESQAPIILCSSQDNKALTEFTILDLRFTQCFTVRTRCVNRKS